MIKTGGIYKYYVLTKQNVGIVNQKLILYWQSNIVKNHSEITELVFHLHLMKDEWYPQGSKRN